MVFCPVQVFGLNGGRQRFRLQPHGGIVRMNTEHAAPYFDDWRGDHFKSSDESNCCGWLRYLFVREESDTLLIGQACRVNG